MFVAVRITSCSGLGDWLESESFFIAGDVEDREDGKIEINQFPVLLQVPALEKPGHHRLSSECSRITVGPVFFTNL